MLPECKLPSDPGESFHPTCPKEWFSRTLRGSCRQQNAAAERVEAGMTIHLALDGF